MKAVVALALLLLVSVAEAKSVKCNLDVNGNTTWLFDHTEMTHTMGNRYTDFFWTPKKGVQNLVFTIFETDGIFQFQVQDVLPNGLITLYTGDLLPYEKLPSAVQGYFYRKDLNESVSWRCFFAP